MITVKVFGRLTDYTIKNEFNLTGVKDTDQLLKTLFNKYPMLEGLKFKVSVDRKIINENTALHNGSEVAILPPFSGG
ncbi:MAG: ThiS family protein [Chlorobi bacterium OLB4]|jgi:Molybdopterin converting factor, small subunit|nr:MAG: ThiS family protein [Chlorobi bacterium OLB4]MBW7855207.1 MoaD/ThiS family protein [Ignavibacteria bacterium]OQY77873.1 MAG: hypothetical protein B6D43_05005 [Ignavibacteriales bacterium UTCHB1]